MIDIYSKSVDRNSRGEPLIVGCEYGATWRRTRWHRAEWILLSYDEDKAVLRSSATTSVFEVKVNTLIFRHSKKNIIRGLMILNGI